MSDRKLIGHIAVDSGQICMVDPSTVSIAEDDEFEGVITGTGFGDGLFPVYFEEEDGGGYGNSRIIVELGGADRGDEWVMG